MKCFLIMVIVVMVAVSCVEDEFGSVAGTWVQQSSTSSELNKLPMDLRLKWETTTIFKTNQTGSIDRNGIDTNGDKVDYSTNRFKYHIKMGTLTITFDEESDNDKYVISGINSYVVSGNKLTITGEDGTITVLTKK